MFGLVQSATADGKQLEISIHFNILTSIIIILYSIHILCFESIHCCSGEHDGGSSTEARTQTRTEARTCAKTQT